MLWRRALPLLVAAGLAAVASPARAQSGTGSCSGMITGTVGLSAPDSSGTLQSVQAAFIPTVFGNAECLCATDDINVEIALTAALPSGTLGTAEVWVGAGCDNYMIRTQVNQTACEKIAVPDINDFSVGSASGGSRIEIPLNAAALMSPNLHTCTTPMTSNAVWIFLYNNPTMPFASCTLQLNEVNEPPAPPQSVSATSGDSAVTVSWTPPSSTLTQPSFFQVLCATADGLPVPNKSAAQAYSTCLPGPPLTIARRELPTGGSLGVVGTDDAGVVAAVDLGTASAPLDDSSSLHTEATDDGGVAADMGGGQGATESGLPPPFENLDPAFICSPSLNVSGTSYSQRIDGLTNGSTYQFVVLSVDRYGNASASEVLMAQPQPVEDLYRRYYDSGGRASGFCFIATAAWGSYEHRYVRVLREFRDRVLLPTSLGGAFVDWYYAHSPPLANYIAAHKAARLVTQLALWPVIGVAAAWLYVGAWLKALALALVLAWLVRRRAAARRVRAA